MTTTIVSSATEITVITDGVTTRYDAARYKLTIENGNVTVTENNSVEQSYQLIDKIVDQYLPELITIILSAFPDLTAEELTKGIAQVKPTMRKTFAVYPESVVDYALAKAHAKLAEAYARHAEVQRQQSALLQIALEHICHLRR